MSTAITIRPIRTEEDLALALKRLDAIFDAAPGTQEGDEAEVLGVLIQSFEREHYAFPANDPVETIRFHMDRLGLKQTDLIPYLGASSRVSEVLARKRNLTVEMIAKLSRGLGIPAEDLLP